MPGAPMSMHTMFKPFLRYDKMGIDYSRITFRHKTPEIKGNTYVDRKQLLALQAEFREKQKKR